MPSGEQQRDKRTIGAKGKPERDAMRKENPQDSLNSERSRTGIPGLDDILGGGLLASRLYLVEGDLGAGKTMLSLQYLREGVKNGSPRSTVCSAQT